MPPKSKIEKCGACLKTVGDRDVDCGIQCEVCLSWFHGKCQDVDEELYKILNKYNDAIHWFCKSCSSNTAKFLTSMVAIQEKVDRIEQEVFHIRNEVRSNIKAKFIQIEQKLEKYAKEVDDKLQVNKSETFLFLESKNEQLEKSVDHKIENVHWSDLFRGLTDDDVQLTSAVDKCIENKMSLISQEINTAQNIIKTLDCKQMKREIKNEGRTTLSYIAFPRVMQIY